MSNYSLTGEPVEHVHYVRAETLSEALSETALIVRDFEAQGYEWFRTVQSYGLETVGFEMTVYVHGPKRSGAQNG